MRKIYLVLFCALCLFSCDTQVKPEISYLEIEDDTPSLNLNYPLAIQKLEEANTDSIYPESRLEQYADKVQLALLYCEEGRVVEAHTLLLKISADNAGFPEMEKYLNTGWAGYYTKIGRPDSAFFHIQRAAKSLENGEEVIDDFEISIINQLGATYLQMGAYEAARTQFQLALEKVEAKYGMDVGLRALLLTNLGFIYGRAANHTEEAKALEEAERIIDSLPYVSPTPRAFFYHQKVQHYVHLMEHYASLQPEKKPLKIPEVKAASEEAASYHKLAQKAIEKVPASLNTALIYVDFAELSVVKGEKRKARRWIEKAEKLMLEHLQAESYYYASLLYLKGVICLSSKKYEESRKLFKQSFTLANKIFSGPHPLKGMVKIMEAHSYIIPGKKQKSKEMVAQGLTIYDEAESYLARSPKIDMTTGVPVFEEVNDYLALRELMQNRGVIFFENPWVASTRLEAKLTALHAFEAAAALNEKILLNFPFLEAQKSSLKHSIRHHTRVIELCDSLFYLTGEQAYLHKALYYTEKSKGTRLLLAQRKNQVKIGDSTFVHRQNQLEQMSKTIAQLQRLKLFGLNSAELDSVNSQLFTERQAYEKALARVKIDFPALYNRMYSLEPMPLAAIQENLSPHQAILEMYNYEGVRVFVVTADTFFLFTTPYPKKGNFTHLPKNMWKGLEEGKVNNSESAFTYYYKSAHEIYTIFFQKALEPLQDIDELFVIGGAGGLNKLPLEILLTEKPKSDEPDYSLENLAYLFEKYSLSYAYSTTTLMMQADSTPSIGTDSLSYIAFAPSFERYNQERIAENNTLSGDCQDLRFNNLVGLEDLEVIRQKFNGKMFTDAQASKARFTEWLPKSQVIHLYTHGCLDKDNQLSSMLIFSDSALLANDLYAMKTSAQMAVLTACETAGGEVSTGEGVIGIANAFAYAGCPSVVAGFWELPQTESRAITQSFFDYIHQGLPKHKALRQAKLDYLKKNQGHSIVPFKWAGMVHIGRVEPLNL